MILGQSFTTFCPGSIGGNGCTDSMACNYNSFATVDDSSCIYPILTTYNIISCDSFYWNINNTTYYSSGIFTSISSSGCSDTSILNLLIQSGGCTDSLADNYDPSASCDDGSCLYTGCTGSLASNYNPLAVTNDSSCIYAVEILPNSTGRANSLQVFVSSDDSLSFSRYSTSIINSCTRLNRRKY